MSHYKEHKIQKASQNVESISYMRDGFHIVNIRKATATLHLLAGQKQIPATAATQLSSVHQSEVARR